MICNEVQLDAVIDIGASVSVIDADIAEHFKWKIDGQTKPVLGADGQTLGASGETLVEVEITINSTCKVARSKVVVVKNLTAPMLIGLDLLKGFKICIDAANERLTFAKESSKGGVTVSHDEVIPPRSQCVVQAQVNKTGDVLTIPFPLENGLAVARVSNNSIPVVVLNTTNKP